MKKSAVHPLFESAAIPAVNTSRPAARRVYRCQEPIRLLKVITAFWYGGTEKQAMNLIRRLDRSVFDLRIASLDRQGHYLPELLERGIDVAEYPVRSFFRPHFAWQQARLYARLRRERTQVVHSYNFYANVFATLAARAAGVPLVIASIRDRGAYLTPLQKQVQRHACSLADLVLVNAESVREWLLEQGYNESRIREVRNGVDVSEYMQDGSATCDLRAQFGLPASSPLIMMLTRITPGKGIDDLMQAAVKVTRRFPAARVVIVGDKQDADNRGRTFVNPEYRRLRALRDKLGLSEQVIFTGYRQDVPGLLAQANLSILPSYSEGMSNTLLESMAAGLPVIATRVGGNPELITDQVTGLLVRPGDVQGLADAMCGLLQYPDRAKAMGRRARESVRKNFSFDEMATVTQRIYIEHLERKLGTKIKLETR